MGQDEEVRQVSMSNTKKEILEAYQELLQTLQDREEDSLDAEARRQELESQEALRTVEGLTADKVARGIGELKAEIGGLLGRISDHLESEVSKFQSIQKAIESKERELQEIYEIERVAGTLAALIEVQRQKRESLEAELAGRRAKLEEEIKETRRQWEKEDEAHADKVAERNTEESRRRQRAKEEFDYEFERQKRRAQDQFEEEKTRLERELHFRTEELDKREESIAASEQELARLRQQVEHFPQQSDAAVTKATKENTERLKAEAKSHETLLRKEFEGQRNVLTTRIDSLEQTIREQSERIAKLSQGQERSYQQVQDIAVKAIEGASNLKAFLPLQPAATEHTGKKAKEE